MTAYAIPRQPEPYERFRSGLTFGDVVAELRHEARQVWELEGRRMFWTRRTVLGRWKQRKEEAYAAYCRYIRGGGR